MASSTAASVLVLSGPNLDRLGKREPAIYGTATLADIHAMLEGEARDLGARVECRQSNHEGDLVTWIGRAADEGFAGVVINAGAYTHTSLAIMDAIKASGLPVIEAHLTNPEAREEYRHKSVIACACAGKVSGFGPDSYALALRGLVRRLAQR